MNSNGYTFSSMLSTENVAGIFGVCPGTVRRWAGEGKLKAYRFGRRKLFTHMDVAEAYLYRTIVSYLSEK
jgi:excisionase family DNA binding protein